MATLIWIALILGAIYFFGRMAIAIALVFAVMGLWHLGEWWSYPLSIAIFCGMFFGTTLWD